MKKHPSRIFLATMLAVIVGNAHAQTVPDPVDRQNNDSEETIVLSPFVVQSDQDTGYRASSTLAGSRLNTPIKDIGAAISVYTKDFLDDIGATSTNDLLVYATGMEAGGPGGNFSNGAGSNITEAAVVGDSGRNSPQNGARARGLAAPTFTRDFFVSDVAIDSYNTSAVTVNRGPNAILFGVASPAGVVDTTPIQADLRKNSNKVEFRYGNNNSLRGSIDVNRVLIPKKLAARLALLHDGEEYNQRPAFETKRRLYGAVTVEPFKSTTFRANVETGNTHANRPFTVLPFDSSKLWRENVGTPFDWTFYDDPARNPLAAEQNSGGNVVPATDPASQYRGYYISNVQLFNTLAFPIANPTRDAGVFGIGFRPSPRSSPSTGPGSLTRDTIRYEVFDPVFNRDSANDTNNFYETRNISEMPGQYFQTIGAQPFSRVPAGIKAQGFTDYSNFDWQGRMIDESGRQDNSFHTFTISGEQRAWEDRLGLQVAYFTEDYLSSNRNNFLASSNFGPNGSNANAIRIDPNLYLPDGRLNPNVGRPYVDGGQAIYNRNLTEREAIRATAFLNYDFEDLSSNLGKWLGRHTVTALGEQVARNELNIASKFVYYGEYDDFVSPDRQAFGRLARTIAYIGPSVIGQTGPMQLTPISMEPIKNGTQVMTTFWSADDGDPNQAELITTPWTLQQTLQNGNYLRDVIKSQAVNLQSYWLDDHLITNVGWRRDQDYYTRTTMPLTDENVFNLERGFDSVDLPSTPPLVAAKEIKSYSAVLRWPEKLMPLPDGMDVSVFANSSENFSPNASRVDPYGNLLPSPTGTTREYGLNFSFLDDRFSVRINRYTTKLKDADIGTPLAMSSMINNVILQTTRFWVSQVNTHPNASRQADIDLLFSPLPDNWKTLYNIRYTGSAATQNLTQLDTQISNYGDTSDFIAKGTEMDLVFNPTKNWRILVNLAKNETEQSNIAPRTQELIARFTPVLDQLANRPKSAAPADYVFPTDANGNITSFDEGLGNQTLGQYVLGNVTVPLANTLAAEGVSSPEVRKYRVNLVTNYQFDRGSPLKGFGIGAGARWQSKVGIGYPVGYNDDGSVFIDKDNPYFAPSELNVDGWVSYSRRIYKDRIDWKLQLNVRNAIGDDQTIAITAQPDGSPASVRLPPERRWYITNTFSF